MRRMPAKRAASSGRKSKPKPRAAAKRAAALAVSGECGLPEVAALKKRLLAQIDAAAPVALDLGGLKSIDTANLQLLAAFVRDRQAKGRAVTWQGVPSWFAPAVRRVGLAGALAVEPS